MADSLKDRFKKLPFSASKKEFHCSIPLPLGKVRYKDKELLDYTNWDFLNLSTHPEVLKSATKALQASGAGSNSARFSTGTLQEHLFCEDSLARFLCAEKGLVFSSKNQVVFTLITNLLCESDLIITQEEVSSPVVDAAYLVGASVKSFVGQRINDIKAPYPHSGGKLFIFVEACSLITGELLFLDPILSYAKKFGASVIIDETGSAGVLGLRGIGLSESHLHEQSILCRLGEFSKGFSGFGGYLVGSITICNYLSNCSAAFGNENSLPPSVVAGLTTSFEILEASLDKRKQLLNLASFFRNELQKLQFSVVHGELAGIVSIFHKSRANADELQRVLFERGILVESVPRGTFRDNSWVNRFVFNSNISLQQVQHTLQILSDIRLRLL